MLSNLLASQPTLAPAALRLRTFEALAVSLRTRGDELEPILDACASAACALLAAAAASPPPGDGAPAAARRSCVTGGSFARELVAAGATLFIHDDPRLHVALLAALVRCTRCACTWSASGRSEGPEALLFQRQGVPIDLSHNGNWQNLSSALHLQRHHATPISLFRPATTVVVHCRCLLPR